MYLGLRLLRRSALALVALLLISASAFAQTVRAGNGTAALPSFTFNGDLNTGFYRFGADTLGFATGGNRVAIFAPDSTLALFTRGRLMMDGPAGNTYLQNTSGADTITFAVAGTQGPKFTARINMSSGGTAADPGLRFNPAGTVYGIHVTNIGGGNDTVAIINNAQRALGVYGGAGATTLIGGAGSMTILAGTGASRTLTLQATTGASAVVDPIIIKHDTTRFLDELVAAGLTASSGTPNAVCIVSASKQLTENAASSCVVSSRRFKENISALPYDSALRIVTQLSASQFTYRQGKRRAIGLIAEDVSRVDPRLVTYDGRGQINSVNYEQVTIALLVVVQQQQRDIDQLHTTLLGLLGAGAAGAAGLAGWRKRKVA